MSFVYWCHTARYACTIALAMIANMILPLDTPSPSGVKMVLSSPSTNTSHAMSVTNPHQGANVATSQT